MEKKDEALANKYKGRQRTNMYEAICDLIEELGGRIPCVSQESSFAEHLDAAIREAT